MSRLKTIKATGKLFAMVTCWNVRYKRALAVGDGALGFWSAPSEVFPETRCQWCRVRKTGLYAGDVCGKIVAKIA
jgi:hypothetical protein